MHKIASFAVNHDILDRGMYISRIDGDVVTYDIRMKKPNGGEYLKNGELHTLEHLLATYLRNSEYSDLVIYVGPMGCRTGFYFLVRDKLTHRQSIALIKNAFRFSADYNGEIPGSKKEECGNYLEHDLETAKITAREMFEVLENITENDLKYKEK